MPELIDTNVYLSRWPFRRVHGDDTATLVKLLRDVGATQAWAGSLDALLHKDVAGVNARLAEECEDHGAGVLVPFGTVNPSLPNWEEDLRRCHEEHRMRGIRLHPNYHGYALDDDRFNAILDKAADANLIVQIAVTMEDERMMHPLVRVEHVDVTPLADRIDSHEAPMLMLLNAFRAVRGELLARLLHTNRVLFDLAWLEGASGIATHLKMGEATTLAFGSYAPVFYFESAKLKLQESPLTDEQRAAITAKNAIAFLNGA